MNAVQEQLAAEDESDRPALALASRRISVSSKEQFRRRHFGRWSASDISSVVSRGSHLRCCRQGDDKLLQWLKRNGRDPEPARTRARHRNRSPSTTYAPGPAQDAPGQWRATSGISPPGGWMRSQRSQTSGIDPIDVSLEPAAVSRKDGGCRSTNRVRRSRCSRGAADPAARAENGPDREGTSGQMLRTA